MPRPFDLITFDFDGVLLHNTFDDVLLATLRDAGLSWPAERERILRRYVHEYYGSGQAMADRLEHGEHQYWAVTNSRFAQVLQAAPWDDELAATVTERFTQTPPLYYYETGVHDLLNRLRTEGYALGMLTNRDDQVHEFGAEWDLIRHFDFIGTRQTVGKPKPDPALFQHIAQHFSIAAERALHIGDNPFADVRGARAAGWSCVLIDPDDLFPDWDVPRLPMVTELPGWLAHQPVT